jgi:hypothetical protein
LAQSRTTAAEAPSIDLLLHAVEDEIRFLASER